jgi:hypothetical protein
MNHVTQMRDANRDLSRMLLRSCDFYELFHGFFRGRDFMKRNEDNRGSDFVVTIASLMSLCQRCERGRGTQNEKGRVCKALFDGSIPSRASTSLIG